MAFWGKHKPVILSEAKNLACREAAWLAVCRDSSSLGGHTAAFAPQNDRQGLAREGGG